MKKYWTLLLLLWIAAQASAQQKIQGPEEFLGYPLGERFTPHQRTVAYYYHVAEAMENVGVFQYGETYEHRPLIYAVITSPENFKDLEEIRINNLRRAGMADGKVTPDKKAIVWLSYNVHGDEASSMEASMLTLYALCNPANTTTREWLKNTIVILDPCMNPDGRDRYANFYHQYGNAPLTLNADAYEHHQPWPGGRPNHYLFDLNRDWAWGTQIESRQRINVYNTWMPHVHVDFHEQGYNRPYYFAPAAEPFHEVVSPWQREFQTMIGKNNARYFDEQGWLYFTREIFDLYYPSYGDTYPTYNGAIGMTYEQAGGGSGGLGVTTSEGDPLTLKDRLLHHHTTGLSTIEITAQHYGRVVDEFEKYFRENISAPSAAYKTFVIKAENNSDKVSKLLRWMDLHGIQYGYSGTSRSVAGFDYQLQKTNNFNLTADDIVVNVYQPKSRFISAVFEPQSKLPDSLTYDITAWNLFYSYDLKAFAVKERINAGRPYQAKPVRGTPFGAEWRVANKPYAYIFRYQSVQDAALLASMMKKGIKVRSAQSSFTANGQSFDAGTLIVTRRNNERISDFDSTVQLLAGVHDRKIYTTATGFVEKGRDIGSGEVNYLNAPNVAMLMGEQTSSLAAGEVWYFFEQELHYPLTQIGVSYFGRIDWKKYTVLIVPDGYYKMFDENVLQQLAEWVADGGRLIVMGNGLAVFADEKGFGLRKFTSDFEKDRINKAEKDRREKEALMRYADAERKGLSEVIFGAIYNVSLDNTHPLAFGLRDTYFTLKTNELRYAFLEKGWNVGVIKGKPRPIQGFAGHTVNLRLENSLVFGVEEKGSGNIIYMVDNPLFRNFWENGKLLFTNAVFMVGQ